MPRSVLLVVNTAKPEAVAAAKEVAALIARHGTLLAQVDSRRDAISPRLNKANLIVTLGGDGTLLAQARRCAHLSIPLLGVNFGKLGFLAEFDLDAVRMHAKSLFSSRRLEVREVAMLAAEVYRSGSKKPVHRGLALNELVVTAGPPFRMIEMTISIDCSPGPILRGDGLIVSTPVGSTAYTLSAGGPLLAPNVDALVITPIAPQSLAFRPIVVAPQSRIEIDLQRINDSRPRAGTALVIDGQELFPLNQGDRIVITRHPRCVKFVTNPATNFWATLINKLRWAMAPDLQN